MAPPRRWRGASRDERVVKFATAQAQQPSRLASSAPSHASRPCVTSAALVRRCASGGQQFCVHMQNCQLMRARTPHRGAAHDARIRPLHREGFCLTAPKGILTLHCVPLRMTVPHAGKGASNFKKISDRVQVARQRREKALTSASKNGKIGADVCEEHGSPPCSWRARQNIP